MQGKGKANVAANSGTRAHVPFEISEEWKHWGTACDFWLLVGPKARSCVFVRNNGPGSGFWPLILSPFCTG
eukprot:3846800-Amphidinium_carterae.1